jgi:excisionase family DNA binding protein
MEAPANVTPEQGAKTRTKKRTHTPPERVEPVFIAINTTADALDCSKPEVYSLIKDGKLRAKKMGRATKIVYADVKALVDRLPDYPKSAA